MTPASRARSPFQLDPASAVLHYAQEIFEGMKAYRTEEGSITLFRPEENARRFQASAKRMAMPEMPGGAVPGGGEQLVRIDREWVPSSEGSSLYIRPFMFASESFLGVRPAHSYTFCVIASPVGAYFKGGEKPISVWISDAFSRAAQGGTGAAKCGGNYAASLLAQAEAAEHGCDQVVFLDAAEHRWVEELGGMNIFFLMDDGSIVTPPLGTILPGITRASLIRIARDAGSTSRRSSTPSTSGGRTPPAAASGSLRLRHRRGRRPHRQRPPFRRRIHHRRRRGRPGDRASSAKRWSECSAARARTSTAGSTGSPDPASRRPRPAATIGRRAGADAPGFTWLRAPSGFQSPVPRRAPR